MQDSDMYPLRKIVQPQVENRCNIVCPVAEDISVMSEPGGQTQVTSLPWLSCEPWNHVLSKKYLYRTIALFVTFCCMHITYFGLFCFLIFIHLLYISTAVFPPSSPPTATRPPSPLCPPATFPPSATPLFLFRKGLSSHEYWWNLVYQVAVRLSPLPCAEADHGDPVWG